MARREARAASLRGDTADPRAAVEQSLADHDVHVRVPDSETEAASRRISTEYHGVNVIAFTAADPIEVRAYDLLE